MRQVDRLAIDFDRKHTLFQRFGCEPPSPGAQVIHDAVFHTFSPASEGQGCRLETRQADFGPLDLTYS
jgi:hypothetical protein